MTPFMPVVTPKEYGIWINQRKAKMRGGWKRR